MKLEKPALRIRVEWPESGNHAAAVEAIGRALSAVLNEQKYRTEPESHWGQGYDAYHFTLDVTHTVPTETVQ